MKLLDKLRANKLWALAATLLTLASGVTVALVLDQSGHVQRVEVTVHKPAGDLSQPVPLKDETPPGVSPQKHEQVVDQAPALEKQLVKPVPVGGAQIYSCRQLYGGHLWSSRNGIRPTEFVVHYTAGNGTPEAIDAYFRGTRAASATYILGLDGHCIQEVPESEKPWTQLSANPYAISVEIVTTGYNLTRAQWLATPIFKRGILAALMRDAMHRHGIPLRHVGQGPRSLGCNFVPGWTDHDALGCGNDHVDVTPSFPYDVLQHQLVAGTRVAAGDRARCHQLNWYRRRRAHGTVSAKQTRLAVHRRHVLERHRVHCVRPRR